MQFVNRRSLAWLVRRFPHPHSFRHGPNDKAPARSRGRHQRGRDSRRDRRPRGAPHGRRDATRPPRDHEEEARLDALRLLLREGADPNGVDSAGSSLLQVAISIMDDARMRVAMAMALLEVDADVALTDRMGRVPLHVAAAVGSTEVVGMLLDRAPETLNQADGNGCTPLMAAAEVRQETLHIYLLHIMIYPSSASRLPWPLKSLLGAVPRLTQIFRL